MALRAGSVGLRSEAGSHDGGWRRRATARRTPSGGRGGGSPSKPDRGAAARGRAQLGPPPGGPGRQATNSRLRTGTDKGNPTV